MRYFLATYYKKPNGKFNEAVKLDTKVRMKDLQAASIIIDYKERKIIKSNFEEELGPDTHHDFDTINKFYKEHYPQVISQLEAKYEVLNAALELATEMVDMGAAAEENPDVIKDEIDKDIVDKLKKIAEVDHVGKAKIDQIDADVGLDTVEADDIS